MRLPPELIIGPDKLRHYLLIQRPTDDKSKYLASAGFNRLNAEQLEAAIRQLALTYESHEDRRNEYGTFWRTEGDLRGPTGDLPVVLIWLEWLIDGTFHFVTLKPHRHR